MPHPVKMPYQLIPAPELPLIWHMRSRKRFDKQCNQLKKLLDAKPHMTLLLREDVVFDTSVLKGLLTHENAAVVSDDGLQILGAFVSTSIADATQSWIGAQGEKPSDIRSFNAAEIANAYDLNLRKREKPSAYILSSHNVKQIEWQLFMTAYKGVTDLVTKYWWPVPAFYATRWCAKHHITPNQVTFLSGLLVLACLWLFAHGFFGLGMFCAWIMTFLDTVDGKLARVTLTSSPLGNIFDHGIDLIHPPFWYYAWAIGLQSSLTPIPDAWFSPLIWALFVSYIAGRLCEGYFSRRYGMHMHVWRRIDSRFRLILARRNPNMILLQLSLFIMSPDIGFYAVVVWTVLCTIIQCLQIIQAEAYRMRGEKITSWLDTP